LPLSPFSTTNQHFSKPPSNSQFAARRVATNALLTSAKRFEGTFLPREPKPFPIGVKKMYLTPTRVRPQHWTAEELNALPKPTTTEPNLNKGKYAHLFPIAVPVLSGWSFYIFNNMTGIYSDRFKHLRPY
jgi:hypothetical protein